MYDNRFRLHFLLSVLLSYFFLTLFLQHSFAQNYTQMSLPDGAKTRLGKGYIKDILYSPDGNLFVVVSSIGHWLYNTTDYQEITLLPIPKSPERAIAHKIQKTNFSVDGQMLISDTREKQVIIWDVTTEESYVISLADGTSLSADGKILTIQNENKTVELWHGKKEIIEKQDKKSYEIDIITV